MNEKTSGDGDSEAAGGMPEAGDIAPPPDSPGDAGPGDSPGAIRPDAGDAAEVTVQGRNRRRIWPPLVITIVLTVSLVLLVFASTPRSGGNGARPGQDDDSPGVAELGKMAPDFAVETLDGGEFRLSDQRGRIVLVNFWASWCVPCEKEVPDLIEVYSNRRDTVTVVGIALNDAPSSVREFVERKEVPYPVALDDGVIAGPYLVAGLPTTVIVDADGKVAMRVQRAFPDAAAIYDALAQVETDRSQPGSRAP